jgi:hypothetical protein
MKNTCGIETDRAPLGRMNLFMARYPARWAELRDRHVAIEELRHHRPLARIAKIPGMDSVPGSTKRWESVRGRKEFHSQGAAFGRDAREGVHCGVDS